MEVRGTTPYATTEYKDIIANIQTDAAVISTSWSMHLPITIDFMEAGVRVAFEVGDCDSVEECWELVRAYRKTGLRISIL